uniref:Uncharacterized protein n=1 Tax=Myoviridae sp. ctZ2t4 TaxID=2827693 RepID=A0A8S5SSJ7_9CAUD|nr:MAG TPA: hypothetical protein [Myoviridae sp. ctZ2t4]
MSRYIYILYIFDFFKKIYFFTHLSHKTYLNVIFIFINKKVKFFP